MPAVTTDVQVANQALGFVGQRRPIASLLEDSPEAIACRTHFDTVKACILEADWWTWATKRQALALTSHTREGWDFCYAAPGDLISTAGVRYIDQGRPDPEPVPFLIELNSATSQFLILTDYESPTLVYTRDVPVALWPAVAITALAAELALRLAPHLPVKPQLVSWLKGEAESRLLEAKAADANARGPEAPQQAVVIRQRAYSGG